MNKEVKECEKEKDYAYYSEALHSSYLFYTMEVDRLAKKNKVMREALELIATKNPVYICWSLENVIEDCCKDCEENKDGCIMNPKYLAQQALKEL